MALSKMVAMKSLGRALLAILASSLALSGCKGPSEWCPGREPLDDAADYRWLISEQRYFEPLNAWTRHERLEVFLLKVYREGGLNALQSRYGFDCRPRIVTPPCDTCFICRRTIAKTKATGEPEAFYCQIGQMTIHGDFGPGWTTTAMTYWDRLPVGTHVPPSPLVTR